MKKTLAILLALIMILSVSLVACTDNATTGGNGGGDNGGLDDDDGGLVAGDWGDDDGDGTVGGNNGNDGDGSGNTGNGGNTSADGEVACDKTVYPMCNMVMREDSTTSNKKTTVSNKQALKATAVIYNDEDEAEWYKISYQDKTYYINAYYVTENLAEATFTDLEESAQFTLTVKETAKEGVNIRKYPALDPELTSEEKMTVNYDKTKDSPLTVIAKNGTGNWFKVKYNGAEWYLKIVEETAKWLDGLDSGANPGEGLPG